MKEPAAIPVPSPGTEPVRRCHGVRWLTLAAASGSGVTMAQGGITLPAGLSRAWVWDPPVLLGLYCAAFVYALGVARLWRRAGIARGVNRLQAGAGWLGLLVLFFALLSPLDTAASLLFSAHMVQHLLLVLVAAPLIVLGWPVPIGLWALPLSWRKGLTQAWLHMKIARAWWHSLSHPVLVWLLYAATFWLWHVPAFYQAALRHPVLHGLEHLSLFGVACLFWWTLLSPQGRRRLGSGAAVLYVFTTSLQGSALGALLTFSPRPWYGDYQALTAAFGLSPLQDQQLAGLLMWVPVGVLYTVLAAALFVLWVQELERSDASDSVRSASLPTAEAVIGGWR